MVSSVQAVSYTHLDVYKRQVYYIVKEKFEEKLPGVLEKAIEQLRKQKRRVVLQCHGGVKANLKLDDILCFERDKRVTYVAVSYTHLR